MKTKMLSTFVTLCLSVFSFAAVASFDDLKRESDRYRDSGQLAQDRQVRAAEQDAREHRAAIPNTNRRRLASVRAFAGKQLRGQPRTSYNAEGEVQIIEFATTTLQCRMDGNSGTCIERATLEQYECEFNFDWDLICMRKR